MGVTARTKFPVSLRQESRPHQSLLRDGPEFGLRNRAGWAEGPRRSTVSRSPPAVVQGAAGRMSRDDRPQVASDGLPVSAKGLGVGDVWRQRPRATVHGPCEVEDARRAVEQRPESDTPRGRLAYYCLLAHRQPRTILGPQVYESIAVVATGARGHRSHIPHLVGKTGVTDCFRGGGGAPYRGWIPAFAGTTEVGDLGDPIFPT